MQDLRNSYRYLTQGVFSVDLKLNNFFQFCGKFSMGKRPYLPQFLSDFQNIDCTILIREESYFKWVPHTSLEGVKYFLQFSNNEPWWALKSAFRGLKKNLFQQNRPRAFWEIWLENSLKPIFNNFCGTIKDIAFSALYR